jgi:hypothetical protein
LSSVWAELRKRVKSDYAMWRDYEELDYVMSKAMTTMVSVPPTLPTKSNVDEWWFQTKNGDLCIIAYCLVNYTTAILFSIINVTRCDSRFDLHRFDNVFTDNSSLFRLSH